MSDAKTGGTIPKSTIVTAGAFDYWPGSASRIIGLGGSVIDPDPAYAFHTKYLELGTGVVRCALRFVDLDANVGWLTIHVNGLPHGPGAAPEVIRQWTVPLRDIAEGEGVTEISFQASAGTRYAVLGHIYGESDARARELTITHETTPDVQTIKEKLAAARKSIFGRRVFRRSNRIIDHDAPTLADPVSQAPTQPQFDEPAYHRWTAEMKASSHPDRAQWRHIYILQTLDRYGMLRPGARGLGFGVGMECLPAVMAARGCTIVATDLDPADPRAPDWRKAREPYSAIEDLRFPDICADDIFDRQVTYRNVDMTAIKRDLSGFDFLWSASAIEHLGSVEAGYAFLRDSVACLSFGGLAVHTTTINLSQNTDALDKEAALLFRRQDLERAAVDLISRGHFVAQFKYIFETPDNIKVGEIGERRDGTTEFGLIVRRGDR